MEFLLSHNGGYPEPEGFLFSRDGENNEGMVDRFLAIYQGEYSNFEWYLKNSENRIPKNLIPIAHDPGGNLILLSVRGEDYGKVYFWDHDWEVEDGELPDYSNVYPIANSFREFLATLREF